MVLLLGAVEVLPLVVLDLLAREDLLMVRFVVLTRWVLVVMRLLAPSRRTLLGIMLVALILTWVLLCSIR